MVQSPFRAADWLAASQEIPRISRNPKVLHTTKLNLKYSFPDPGSFYPASLHNLIRIIMKLIQARFKLKSTAVSRHINIQQVE